MKTAILLLLFSQSVHSQRVENTPQLSSQAEISVLTLGPWQGEVFTAFGHSAIRIYDPGSGIDYAFNYGVFDFDQPYFYLNYTRGHLYFKLGVYPYPAFRDSYISYNRYIHEQILNLTPSQKQTVFDFLYWNARPENANYYYDYFYDNCASRIRDVVKGSLKDAVTFDSTFITTRYTIRQLTDLYLVEQPWGDLGIDICLGLPMDKRASPFEYMFLPDYIESSFDHATIKNDSVITALVKSKISVYESRPMQVQTSMLHPWVVFGTLLALVSMFTWLDWRKRKLSGWLDVVLFGIIGLVGWLLLLLWVATDHRAAARNLNLLWAMPLHLILLPFYLRRSPKAGRYFKTIAILNLLLLATWAWLPQQLNVFLVPLVIALTVRAAWIGYYLSPTTLYRYSLKKDEFVAKASADEGYPHL